ncbi:tetraspanin-32 [Protopterus annectens]|uniref:tetraspanin-32 n=1 Tax=Protopterus annectens TaxID=7888 RepID=UPI001CFB14BD|nr:tetraspanin-32 [Protopterus annectens]
MLNPCWIRATKCQLLITSLFSMVLGFGVSIAAVLTCYSPHFTLIRNVIQAGNTFRMFQDITFYSGICLSLALISVGFVCFFAAGKESKYLLAVGFVCFAVLFCGMIQVGYWRYSHDEQVENVVKDIYDFLYEDVRQNTSSTMKWELHKIHAMFSCCGKKNSSVQLGRVEMETCSSEIWETGEDCLHVTDRIIKKHIKLISVLLLCITGFSVYGMVLTSFLYFLTRLRAEGNYGLTSDAL